MLNESINIHLNNKYTKFRKFGEENRDFMTDDVYIDILETKNSAPEMVSYAIQKIHYNTDHPENNNILLNNYMNSTVYEGEGNWKPK